MSGRINVILPDNSPAVLDRVAPKGQLRDRLKREALANAERDLAMAAERFPVEVGKRRSKIRRTKVLSVPV